MGILGLLVFILGSFGFVCGSKCLPETAECSQFWVKMEPHKNLLETEDELDSWCRKQSLFYSCLESVILGPNGNLSHLPVNLLISKMFSEDLCMDGSSSRKRYLDNAACINQLDTDYCTLPEYLDIVTPDDFIPPSRCSLSEKTFSCIAATLVMNCGFDAGRVYRYLLKVMRYGDEVCDIESSEGVPPCSDPESVDREKIPEIYYGLLHRFGDIPEQADESDLSETVKSNAVHVDESVIADEIKEAYYGLLHRIGDILEQADEPDSSEPLSEAAEPNVPVDESVIADAIREALDSIEEKSEEQSIVSDIQKSQSSEYVVMEEILDSEHEFDIYKKPIITEPFKGLLHYNYSGKEFALYWKQPDNFTVQSLKCEHLLPSSLKGVIFRCVLQRRLLDPPCLATESHKNERITPTLIRDIDPDVPDDSTTEIGPCPFWLDELDVYKRQKELRELKIFFSDPESFPPYTNSKIESSSHISCEPEAILDLDFEWWRCHNLFSKDLRQEIVSVLLPNLSEGDLPSMSIYYDNDMGYAYFFEERLNDFESVTCGRVNECHDVFKCTIKPRASNPCHFCEEFRNVSPAFDVLRNLGASSHLSSSEDIEIIPFEDSEPVYKSPSENEDIQSIPVEGLGLSEYESTTENVVTLLFAEDDTPAPKPQEPESDAENIIVEEHEIIEDSEPSEYKSENEDIESIPVVEGSGLSEYETKTENVVTLLFAEDDTPAMKHQDPELDAENIVVEEHEIVEDEDSSVGSIESDNPDISLMILDSIAEDSEERSEYFGDFVHSEDEESVNEESEETYEFASDDANGYSLLKENVLFLQPISSDDNVETTYEIIRPDEDDSLNGSAYSDIM